MKKGEVLPICEEGASGEGASAAFLAVYQQYLIMVGIVNHKPGIFPVPIPLSFLLKLLGFYVV